MGLESAMDGEGEDRQKMIKRAQPGYIHCAAYLTEREMYGAMHHPFQETGLGPFLSKERVHQRAHRLPLGGDRLWARPYPREMDRVVVGKTGSSMVLGGDTEH
ncbi:hypothetical protein N7462_002560 [Penicillium macrosclerotiorum]|uniref:uncharacterized protein n=1 Tax=Penicillium macrosclerotiorum TaxID=303699 RepID=UPI002547D354|nr:uncharacterized protein N7462_002560 [Penicillium macrosclerotiorum]KAJ5693137.1 hypothetical protein N7462_002560 [Penicillium macrosclerotiorum]